LPDAEWAVQRRLDDLIGKLEPKFGDLRGRVEVIPRPSVTFAMIGGAESAKAAVSGLSHALRMPELYRRWGIAPPRGGLLRAPGTARPCSRRRCRAVRRCSITWLATLTSKVGPAPPGDQGVFQPRAQGKESSLRGRRSLSFEHLPLTPGAAAPLLIGICELLDGLRAFPSLLVLASTSRPDGIGSFLIAPGRLDHLIEVPLPDGPALREIVEIQKKRAEALAERTLFEPIDGESIVPRLTGMSGGEVAEVIHRALEEKVHQSGGGTEAGLVGTSDLITAVDESRRVRDVVVKIRYGQYL
jgi:ATP-dependent 26S proteasome regulatory subunit